MLNWGFGAGPREPFCNKACAWQRVESQPCMPVTASAMPATSVDACWAGRYVPHTLREQMSTDTDTADVSRFCNKPTGR